MSTYNSYGHSVPELIQFYYLCKHKTMLWFPFAQTVMANYFELEDAEQ